MAHIAEGGRAETQRLAVHGGRAHKLALQPDQPACFLSCGEDGVVRHFDLREGSGANSRRLLVCRAGSTGTGRSSSVSACTAHWIACVCVCVNKSLLRLFAFYFPLFLFSFSVSACSAHWNICVCS